MKIRVIGGRALVVFLAMMLAGMAACSPPHLRGGRTFSSADRARIVATAERCLGTPYRYGGESPGGFDCSGLVMYVFGKHGIALPRTAGDQFEDGARVPLAALQPGDLVFFRTAGGRGISHVGIYTGKGEFIHAPRTGTTVSYARLDNKYWKRHYAGAVTYFRRKNAAGTG
ncbi:MAG: NlpC/P60 family protein [Spirochaetes bacterium]|nr:MAG: NlpC/P60 family protein [Spirochaetota bacterium]